MMQLRLQHTCQPYRSLSQVGRTVLQSDEVITGNSENRPDKGRAYDALQSNHGLFCVLLASRVCNDLHVVQARAAESRLSMGWSHF